MKKNTDRIQPGWPIPEAVRDSFRDFCSHVGTVAQEDCAGALFLWQRMPSRLREWAKLDAKGSPQVPKEFWDGLSDGLDASIQDLLKSLQDKPPTEDSESD